MEPEECEECLAIRRQFEAASLAGRGLTGQDLAQWLRDLDEVACVRLRETSALFETWRRMLRHRMLTGHWTDPLLPKEACGSRN